jgi:hypothetical protein
MVILFCNILWQCSSFTYTETNGKPILLGNNGKEKCEVTHSKRIWSAFYGVLTLSEKSLQGISFEENHTYQFKEKYSSMEVLATLILGLSTSITVKTLEIEDCGIYKEQKEETKKSESNEG